MQLRPEWFSPQEKEEVDLSESEAMKIIKKRARARDKAAVVDPWDHVPLDRPSWCNILDVVDITLNMAKDFGAYA